MNNTTESRVLDPLVEPFADMLDNATVRIERKLPGPIERIWSYLTDSDKRAKWLAGGPMELREGGVVSLTFRNNDLSGGQSSPGRTCSPDGVDLVVNGVVTRCEPPHLLAFNWDANRNGSEATFELTQEGPDTRVVITHRLLANRKQLLSVSAGWHTHVGILLDLLSGNSPRFFWPEHARLEKVYEERFPE